MPEFSETNDDSIFVSRTPRWGVQRAGMNALYYGEYSAPVSPVGLLQFIPVRYYATTGSAGYNIM